MKLGVVGCGYVGLVTGTCFSDYGNNVTCYDIDEEKITSLQDGNLPLYEPGLKDRFLRSKKAGRLSFTSDISQLEDKDVIFITVGTPSKPNGEANIQYVKDAAKDLCDVVDEETVIVIKSTVPVGTGERVERLMNDRLHFDIDVVSNPEFLREGSAVKDFRTPDRIIIGGEDEALETLEQLYQPIVRTQTPLMKTSRKNSELIKYASNAMLATRISFMNELSRLCDEDMDIKEVAKGMGLDDRIGPRFLQAGVGYGGSCFPKDVKAVSYMLEERGHHSELFRGVNHINEMQKKKVVPYIENVLDGLEEKNVGIWGCTFKPKTDDIRNAPSITIIKNLLKSYCNVTVYDPEGLENLRQRFGDRIGYGDTMYEVAEEADALLLLTEWDAFRNTDFEKVYDSMKQPVLFDGRNIYDKERMKTLGFRYHGIGR
mgnify:CR=1 FL=1